MPNLPYSLHFSRRRGAAESLGPLVAKVSGIGTKRTLRALSVEPGLERAVAAVAAAGEVARGEAVWFESHGEDGWRRVDAGFAPSALIDDPGVMFRDDPEVVRHRLFEGDADVGAPLGFESGYHYGVFFDEAVRRVGGVDALRASPAMAGITAAAASVRDTEDWRSRQVSGADPGAAPAAAESVAPVAAEPVAPAPAEPVVVDAEAKVAEEDVAAEPEGARDVPELVLGGGAGPGRERGSDDSELLGAGARTGRHPRLMALLGEMEQDGGVGGPALKPGGIAPLGGTDFVPPDVLGENTGQRFRALANLDAIEALHEDGPMTRERQVRMAQYVGWGGLPGVFDEERGEWDDVRERMKALMTEDEYAEARGSTLNAHYTTLPVIRSVYAGLAAAGAPVDEALRVLEPSVGTGHFIGAAPSPWRFDATELDGTTARIAAALYPESGSVRNLGFEDHSLAEDGDQYDVAVTNPPFGAYKVHDPNESGMSRAHSIHNYFILKSLKAVRPGGLAAFVVSKFFMDSQKNEHRRLAHEMGELVGAVRLPNTAFEQNAATEVVSDVLVFRRRAVDEVVVDDPDWLHADRQADPDDPRNTDFANRMMWNEAATRVIGAWSWKGKMYGAYSGLTVEGQAWRNQQEALGDELRVRLLPQCRGQHYRSAEEAALATGDELASDEVPVGEIDAPGYGEVLRNGGYLLDRGGRPWLVSPKGGRMVGSAVAFRNEEVGRRRLVGLMDIRDAALALVAQEARPNGSPGLVADLRQHLNDCLDGFLRHCSTPAMKRDGLAARTVSQVFGRDPAYPLVSALYAPMGGLEPVRGELLDRRVVFPDKPAPEPRSLAEGVACSLSEFGSLDVDWIAGQLSMDRDECEARLLREGLAFDDPEAGRIVDAGGYLCGDVRSKLDKAREAAKEDPKFEVNVAALEGAQPKPVAFDDIFIQIGAPWIPDEFHERFVNHALCGTEGPFESGGQTSGLSVRTLSNGDVKVEWPRVRYSLPQHFFMNQSKGDYGHLMMDAKVLAEKVLNSESLAVYAYDEVPKEGGGTKKVARLLQQETFEVKQCADRLRAAFVAWVEALDEKDLNRLTDAYNERMNRVVHRSYDDADLSFAGMADKDIELRESQVRGVWRSILERNTLLDHAVGAGKTYTMAAAAKEMRRMGVARRPMFVVPNHLVGQWALEFHRLYPGAKVLTFDPGPGGRVGREAFCAKAMVGDWDAIICPHSTFTAIPVTEERRIAMLNVRCEEADRLIEEIKGGPSSRLSVKAVEKMRKSLYDQAKKLDEALRVRQPGTLYFDHLGVDALFVDESHAYKNLSFLTKMGREVSGLGSQKGSQRAQDMIEKVRLVNERGGRVVFATGTPITNTVCELYHVQRYMDDEGLRKAGIVGLDGWLRTFAVMESDWEVNVTGTKFVNRNRVRAFENVSELSSMYRRFSDVVLRGDLDEMAVRQGGARWPVPALEGGAAEKHVIGRSPEAAKGMERVVDRLAAIEGRTSGDVGDNHLVCLMDARKMGTDVRLVEGGERFDDIEWMPGVAGKVESVADSVAGLWSKWADERGTQLVFSDLGTPKRILNDGQVNDLASGLKVAREALDADAEIAVWRRASGLTGGWDYYNALKVELVARGLPAAEVAFAHEARTDKQKAVLHEKVRQGVVRVMIGSTEKMGTGMNVQTRLVGLHHVDAPWRPADLEQREGRILRPGNELFLADPENFKVSVRRYATEQTADPKMWQSLETKARFIAQLRSGKLDKGAVIEDEQTLSYAEMKALSAANPLILRELDLGKRVKELERSELAYKRGLREARYTVANLADAGERADREREGLLRDVAKRDSQAGIWFETVDGRVVTERDFEGGKTAPESAVRKAAAQEMASKVMEAKSELLRGVQREGSPVPLGRWRGLEVTAYQRMGLGSAGMRNEWVTIEVTGESYSQQVVYETMSNFSASGLITRLENLANGIEQSIAAVERRREAEVVAYAKAVAEVDVPFEKAEELAGLREELARVSAELRQGNDAENAASVMAAGQGRDAGPGPGPEGELDGEAGRDPAFDAAGRKLEAAFDERVAEYGASV